MEDSLTTGAGMHAMTQAVLLQKRYLEADQDRLDHGRLQWKYGL